MEKEKDLKELIENAENGDVEAMVTLSRIYWKEGDASKASEYTLRAAQKGNAGAEFAIGMEYCFGIGGQEICVAEGVRYLRNAAKKNVAQAQFTLAVVFDSIEEARAYMADGETSILYLEKAAKQGHADAQVMLGDKYLKGSGIEKSMDKAIFWWCCACLQEKESSSDARNRINSLLQGKDSNGVKKIQILQVMDDIKANFPQYIQNKIPY